METIFIQQYSENFRCNKLIEAWLRHNLDFLLNYYNKFNPSSMAVIMKGFSFSFILLTP